MTAFNLTQSDGIAHLRFCRPQTSNAMGAEFWSDFLPAIADLDQKGSTRVLVISAEGKNFCSGMDLMAFAGGTAAMARHAMPSKRNTIAPMARVLKMSVRVPAQIITIAETVVPSE